jgi:RimJ/RimL family protein N-acetyltransferase
VPYPELLEIPGARLERWDPVRHDDGLAAACADPEVQRYLGGPLDRAAAAALAARIADHWETFGFGLWAVVTDDRGTAGFAGACRALWHHEHHARTEVGWRLARWAWGRGYATAGGRLGATAAFEVLGLDEVVAFVHPANAASIAVVDRLGMDFAGMTEDRNLSEMVRMYRLSAGAAARRHGAAGTSPEAAASRSCWDSMPATPEGH